MSVGLFMVKHQVADWEFCAKTGMMWVVCSAQIENMRGAESEGNNIPRSSEQKR